MASTQYDYLIIGQGLAGTLITRLLLQAGKSVHLIDAAHRGASTKVAAGIINPVTGRRFVKSWLFAQLYPAAEKMYLEIEAETGLSLFTQRKIIRVLTNAEQENEWHSRSAWPQMEGLMNGPPRNFPERNYLKSLFSLGTTHGGAQVNIAKLIQHYQQAWSSAGILSQRDFDHQQLHVEENAVSYGDLQATRIIFCEGHAVRNNPWFKTLPWELAKGEVLHLRIKDYATDNIVKHHLLYAPLDKNKYWVGSNYEKNYVNDLPSEKGKQWLLERIDKGLDQEYEILNHEAAIRPTVKDRRPLIGRHPDHPQLILFNGLGTKGTSLGPYFAQQLVDHLLNGSYIHEKADLQRYL